MTQPLEVLRARLDDIENTLAGDNDREVAEYRRRYPFSIMPLDAIRGVLDLIDPVSGMAYAPYGTGVRMFDAFDILETLSEHLGVSE